MRLKINPIITIIIALVEIFLCFWGPIALINKPDLIIFPLYTNDIGPDKHNQLENFLEDNIISLSSFNLIGLDIMENYLNIAFFPSSCTIMIPYA